MVKTSSTMLALGSLIPPFDLPIIQTNVNLDGSYLNLNKRISSKMLLDKPVLFMILCAHCPFVKHIENQLTKLDEDFGEQVQLLAIASNCIISHPQDGPQYLSKQKLENGWNFPYLFDEEQILARSLRAACTPDFFLFDAFSAGNKHKLIYRGQLDDSRPNNKIPSNGSHLRSAMNAILNSRKVSINQHPSIGCNIKWRSGFEPSWFG